MFNLILHKLKRKDTAWSNIYVTDTIFRDGWHVEIMVKTKLPRFALTKLIFLIFLNTCNSALAALVFPWKDFGLLEKRTTLERRKTTVLEQPLKFLIERSSCTVSIIRSLIIKCLLLVLWLPLLMAQQAAGPFENPPLSSLSETRGEIIAIFPVCLSYILKLCFEALFKIHFCV